MSRYIRMSDAALAHELGVPESIVRAVRQREAPMYYAEQDNLPAQLRDGGDVAGDYAEWPPADMICACCGVMLHSVMEEQYCERCGRWVCRRCWTPVPSAALRRPQVVCRQCEKESSGDDMG